MKSKNVMDEVSYAMSQGKRVVPLMIEDCPIPFRLARLQYIDFKGDYDSSFANLLKALDSPDPHVSESSPSPANISPGMTSKKNSIKPAIIISAIVLMAALIFFVIFKDKGKTGDSSTAAIQKINADTSNVAMQTAPAQNNKPERPRETNDQQANPGKVAEVVPQNVEQNAAVNPGRINLFAPENGTEILVASSDDWKATVDGKENWSQISYGIGMEAVYGFKGDRPAIFDTFTMLITGTSDSNIKEFELLAGNTAPLGPFQSIGKFQSINVKLFKTPYQEFKFPPVTAKYLKFKLLSSYGSTHPQVYEFQLFGNLK